MRTHAGLSGSLLTTVAGALLVLVWAGALPAAGPVEGLAGITFDHLRPIEYNAGPTIVEGPVVTGFEGARAVIEFETRIPTPAAVVRYGPLIRQRSVAEPVYRKIAYERASGDTLIRRHKVLVDVSGLESGLYDTGLVAGGGGVVAYRVEVFDPDWQASLFHDRRFRYAREGPPREGAYRVAETMVLGPFVDLVGPRSFVVSWETDVPAPGAVIVADSTYGDGVARATHEVLVDGLEPRTRYEYRVRYGADEAETGRYTVRTAPEQGEGGFRFAFASDSRGGAGGGDQAVEGVNHAALRAVFGGVSREGCDLMVFAGDLVDGYTSSADYFRCQIESWKRAAGGVAFSIPIYEGMGNHEQMGDYFEVPDPEHEGKRIILFRDRRGEESAEHVFADAFVNPRGSAYGFGPPPAESRECRSGYPTGPSYSENVYSVNYGNTHFVSLNTNYWFTGVQAGRATARYPSDRDGTALALDILSGNREGYVLPNQLEWLKRDLDAAERDANVDWVFIFTHEPAFPNGGHLYDAMFWGDAGKGDRGGLNGATVPLGDVIDMRNRFWRIVSGHEKVVAVLFGDEHNYSRTLIDSEVVPSFERPVWQIVSGGAGAPFYVQDTSVPWTSKVRAFAPVSHYCVFGVEEDGVSLSVRATSGALVDEVSDLTAETRRR
jgi:3',5'-cyclic AMP phosphodiesterase CpdA